MLVLCPYPQGVAAGQRLKYEQYFNDWRTAGWEIEVSNFMDHAMWDVVWEQGHLFAKVLGVLRGHLRRLRDLCKVHRYDLVYVFMWVTPFGTSLFERMVRVQAKVLIYDVEDNILSEQRGTTDVNPNQLVRFLKGIGKARFLIKHADKVITSSPFLNDFCLNLNERKACTYISSSVDTDRYQPATSYTNDAPVVIGWTGTFSSKVYLDLLTGVFQRLAKRVAFKLCVIGNFDYVLPGVELEVLRWSAAEEIAQLQKFDIGVYPLPIDEWVLGKSGLKAIQYMAFALPCVATEVGTTPLLLRNGENGLLVSTEAEWEEALERLICDPDLRRRLGEQARNDAVEKFSMSAIARQYREVIDNGECSAEIEGIQ
jgi:glycosyltransferase involved in cell wall biosynthesis